jgi:regulator of protease activity HflC (stomatin/prohibitin superfamily)
MAEIRRFPFVRHLRADSTSHVLAFRKGRLARSGRGLAFWFLPMGAAIAEVPIDDRDQAFLFGTRARDFQELTVSGVVTFRVLAPERLAERIDFSIDLERGLHKRLPLDQLSTLLTGLARRIGLAHVAQSTLDELLVSGIEELQRAIEEGLRGDEKLAEMGIEVVSARVDDLRPAPDVARALETPTRETLQKSADQATFERRAFAVEKERAIAENELQNQIELARREADLIARRGENERARVNEEAEARRIEAVAAAARAEIERDTNAARIRAIGDASAEAEKARLGAYEGVPQAVLLALAANELAKKLHVEHLSITPELLGPALARFLDANAGTNGHGKKSGA